MKCRAQRQTKMKFSAWNQASKFPAYLFIKIRRLLPKTRREIIKTRRIFTSILSSAFNRQANKTKRMQPEIGR